MPDGSDAPGVPGESDFEMSDDDLLAELRMAVDESDPPPERLATIAKAALTWRTIDAELAELAFDSTRDLAGVRSETMQRQVTFESADLEIELMMTGDEDRRLIGQLVPAMVSTVVMIVGDESAPERTTTTSDDLGRFSFDDVPTEPVGFAVLDAEGRPSVQTDRISL